MVDPSAREPLSRFKPLLDATPDATIVSDRLGRIVLANAQADALFRAPAGGLVGRTIEELVPPRFRGTHGGHRNQYFQDPRTRAMGAAGSELQALRQDGTEFPAEISLAPLEAEDGMYAVTAIRDVTARRRVEEQFRGLLEAAPDAMVIADARGRIVLVNAQAERLFGYTRAELLGQLVEALIPARFRRGHGAHRTRYIQAPRARPMGAGGLQLYGLRRDGTEFPAEISLSPLESESGRLAITAIRDVTDRKRAEEEKVRLTERLTRLLEDRNRFFTNVSHELRTPLALVLGPAEWLAGAEELPPAARRDLEVIARNARTLLRHVNDLLEVARLEAGQATLEAVEVDVARLVRATASHFDGVDQERGVTLSVAAPHALAWTVDGPKLQRILLNLLSNAFKFTPPGGRISCGLRVEARGERRERRLVLEVADSGPGIPAEQREAVFERFRQLPGEGRAGGNGTGLGLAIAREFAVLHRGALVAGEAPGGGALFRLELPQGAPVAREATPAVSRELAPQELARQAEALRVRPGPEGAPREGAPLVLVVEDNPDMAAFIRDVLAPEAAVQLASGGVEGLSRALAQRPDLVLTDLMMPQGNGEELLRAIRSRPELDGVPVVILTARGEDALRVKLLREGAQDHLTKPFSAEELRARIMGLVAAKRAREVLAAEVSSQERGLEALAREVATRKRELSAALAATRDARDEARRASRAKSEFLALVSHELRTPLTTLNLLTGRLGTDPDATERQRRLVPRLTMGVRRLTGLVDALLEHSRLASGRLVPRRVPVDVRAVVLEAVEATQAQVEAKGLALSVDAPPGPPVETDPRFLRIALDNLLANAVKFTSSGGVRVSVTSERGEARIAVSDTGPGIAPGDRDRIFEAFEQLAPIVSKSVPGVGLGLALVRELCQALGGRVEVDSEPGEGSTFTLVLPTGEPAPAEVEVVR